LSCETPPLTYHDALPPWRDIADDALVIFDERLLSIEPLGAWLAQSPLRYSVEAGEGLKDLAAFPAHVEKLVQLASPLAASRMSVVAVGGGSVGDFAGFFASVFRRGVKLTQVPSTWLAAIDSAHGGKNALNVASAKNQVGTFHFPAHIHLVRPLLFAQHQARVLEAFGELAKIALIDTMGDKSPPWVEALTDSPLEGGELLWRFLPDAIAAKYRVVSADPFERKGQRHRLNLGHTLGHVLEMLYDALPHGLAVAQGLRFALCWSERRGLLAAAEHARIRAWLEQRFCLPDLAPDQRRPPRQRFAELLLQDKKRADEVAIHFVFVRGFGQVFTEKVDVAAIVEEAVRQGYAAP
jgi:3-dehydroquinate synthase